MSGPRSGLVAVLFTDLVGSTQLMAQLGDRAFDELRRRHFAALGKAIAAHGGEDVKNTGDGLMAVLPSAAEAVEAAVAMQQATARQAKSTPLAIRVGVAVGDATFEDGDYFGTPVVEAARLVAAARPGQILITQIGRALAGVRCAAAFIDVEPLQLKGLPEPVAVCEVGWEPAGSSVPLPSLLTDIGRVFVGRDGELDRLAQLWKEAGTAERQVALLAGEPGIGKTRLAAELASRVHDEGGMVLAGRCDEDLGVPYQPFVAALRHFVDHTPRAEVAERLGRYAGELVRLVPELSERLPDLPPPLQSDPETERYRLFDAVAAWLDAASAPQGVLLILDDLQWAAKPTLLLLRHLVSAPVSARVMILGTYRDSELVRGHPLVELLADLRRRDGVVRLSLVGLDSSGVAAFLEQAAGHSLDDADVALARAIHEETEGNPFFVREVFRHLAEIGAVERRDGGWATRLPVEELGIPESVKEVIGRRLSRLSDAANRTLRTAAVVGAEFEAPVVQEAGSLDEDTLLSSLEEATDARLVLATADARRYRFAHALVRDTLYDELTPARRITAHRRVAEAIERIHATGLDDHLPALAHHWGRASAPAADTSKAVQYAVRAGDRALAQLANDEAVTYYGQALELLDASEIPKEQQQIQILISLGEAQRRAGDPGHRDTLLHASQLAAQQGDTDALARAALANTRGTWASVIGAVDHERVRTLEAALQTLGAAETTTRARLLAALGLELVFTDDRERRVRLADEALTIARRCGDAATLAYVLLRRFTTISVPDTLPERLVFTEELVGLAERLGDPVQTAWSLLVRFRALVEAAEMSEADRCLDEAVRLSVELGQPTLRWLAGVIATARTILAGNLDEGEQRAHDLFTLGEASGQHDAGIFLAAHLFVIRYDQGRLGEVEERMTEQVAAVPALAIFPAWLALLFCELDRPDEAVPHYETLAADNFSGVPKNNVWLQVLPPCAVVCAYLGDSVRARVLFDLLTPYANQISFTGGGSLGSIARYLALLATTLGDFDEADRRFAEAADTHQRIGAPTWLARTRLEWARLLFTRRRPGDAEQARELLGEALDSARELGLANVERRAVELLQ